MFFFVLELESDAAQLDADSDKQNDQNDEVELATQQPQPLVQPRRRGPEIDTGELHSQ
jgi:hypothetical protein